MSFDLHANLAISTVATAPVPAASGTSLVLAAGDGAKLPAAPFNMTVWPVNTQPTQANAEILRVTNVAVDTLTISRGTATEPIVIGPRAITVGDQIALSITVKALKDVENAITGGTAGQTLGAGGVFVGAATLLHSGQGTDTTAAAATVDSFALSGLTAKDTIVVYYTLESITQQTANVILYDVTNTTSLVSLSGAAAIAAGDIAFGIATAQQRVATAGNGMFCAQGIKASKARLDDATAPTLTSNWTGSYTLGLRHNGVTAGGTFKYTWSVYKVAGQ